jgi:hypothetical protein
MEIDIDLDGMFPYFDHPKDAIYHSHPMDISVAQNFDKEPSTLLTSCKGYVENNITKGMELVTDAWKRSQTITSFRTRAHSFL